MRWFRKLEDNNPRLISLSPLRGDTSQPVSSWNLNVSNNGSGRHGNHQNVSESPYLMRPNSAPIGPCSLRRKHAVRRRPAERNPNRWRPSNINYENRGCETPDLCDFWNQSIGDDQFALAQSVHPPEIFYAALKNLQGQEETQRKYTSQCNGQTISHIQGRHLSPIRAYERVIPPRRTSSMDNLFDLKNSQEISLKPSVYNFYQDTCKGTSTTKERNTEDGNSKTKWKILSDKYFKNSPVNPNSNTKPAKPNFASGFLNKIKPKQQKSVPEKGSQFRSFSCGTLPNIKEFHQRRQLQSQNSVPVDAVSNTSFIVEENEPTETDNDSGIVQEWSDTSISTQSSPYISQVQPCQTLSSWRRPQPRLRTPLSPILQAKHTKETPKIPKYEHLWSNKVMETVQETSETRNSISSKLSGVAVLNPELTEDSGTCHKTRIHVQYPAPAKFCSNSLDRKHFSKNRKLKLSPSIDSSVQFIRIHRDLATGGTELGILISRKKFSEDNSGYVVAHIVQDGLVDRDGRLQVGDEIVNVNGRRLRNMSMSEASSVLRMPVSTVDLVISRKTELDCVNFDEKHEIAPTIILVNQSPNPGNHDYENVKKLPLEIMHSADDSGIEASEDGSLSSESEPIPPESKPETHEEPELKDKAAASGRSSDFCTLPRKPKLQESSSFFTVFYEKGPGKKSLGFTIVGGKDSPKGAMGFYVKTILAGGQAAQDHRLQPGDELIAVNGLPLEGLRHAEAIAIFKSIKSGPVNLQVSRRPKKVNRILKARSCENLLQEVNNSSR